MKRARSARIGCSVLFGILAITVALGLIRPTSLLPLFYRHQFRVGNQIIAKVEAFRASRGRLPETLKDVGIDDADLNVYYEKVSEDEYSVRFGIWSVGESESYNSRTKKWD